MDVVDCKFILSVPFCVCVCDLSQYVLVQHLVQFMAGYISRQKIRVGLWFRGDKKKRRVGR